MRIFRSSPLILAGILCAVIGLSACAEPKQATTNPEAAKRILKLRGYNFDEKSFLSAAASGDVLAVNAFLAAGMSPNVKNEDGEAPLHSAASRGDLEMVKALLQGGADLNLRDSKQYTPILRAVASKREEVADFMLTRQNLDLNAQGANGTTVLMSYVFRSRADVVKSLLDRGADVKLADMEGDTALHGAAQQGNVNVVRALLEKGANPNAQNKVGGTALMWAAVFGHKEVAQLLIEKGADARLKDEDGMTAASWAAKNKRDEMVEFLRGFEASRP